MWRSGDVAEIYSNFFVCHLVRFSPGISGCHLLVAVILCLIGKITAFFFFKKSQLHTLEEIPTRKMNADSQQNSRKEGRKKKKTVLHWHLFLLITTQ